MALTIFWLVFVFALVLVLDLFATEINDELDYRLEEFREEIRAIAEGNPALPGHRGGPTGGAETD